MSWAAVIMGGVSLVGSGIKYAQGRKQQRMAEQMNPVDPGYQRNQGVIDNARILRDRYGNFTLPGYEQAVANINLGSQMAFSQGAQGATSSSDIMDLAARIAYGQSQAQNQLAMQNAQGQDAALMDYLQANAMAGQEDVNANAWDREQYLRREQRQADLYNAGMINSGQAISEGLNTLGTVGAYKFSSISQNNNNGGTYDTLSLGDRYGGGINTVLPGAQIRRNPIQPVQTRGVNQLSSPMLASNGTPLISPLRLSRIRNIQPVYQLPNR